MRQSNQPGLLVIPLSDLSRTGDSGPPATRRASSAGERIVVLTRRLCALTTGYTHGMTNPKVGRKTPVRPPVQLVRLVSQNWRLVELGVGARGGSKISVVDLDHPHSLKTETPTLLSGDPGNL